MSDEESSSTFSSTEGISAYFVFFLTLLAVVLVLSKLLHDRRRLSSVLPEAGLTILIGIAAGSIINIFLEPAMSKPEQDDDQYYADSIALSLLSFSPNVFFVALLPPIIYNSGYHLRRELFFRHLFPISLFAVIGTTISTLFVAFFLDLMVGLGLTGSFEPTWTEMLTFGALISATDPVSTLAVFQAKRVDPHLFYLVFGESVLNDAVGIVLFNAFAKFVARDNGAGKIITSFGAFIFGFLLDALGSPCLGLLCGCVAALLFKKIDMRTNKLLELSLYVLIVYVPFLLAELMHLSGIVTILFTGMAARSFVVPNLSVQTAENAESLFRLAAHLAETSIFLELGLSVFGLKGSFNAKFTFWALFACLLARAMHVYPITLFFNKTLQQNENIDDVVLGNKQVQVQKKAIHGFPMEELRDSLSQADHHESEQIFHQPRTIEPAETDLSSITPLKKRDMKILPRTAHMLWFSGLRGAVAYACVRSFPNTFGHRNEFTVTTMVIILVTVFLLGSTTEIMLNFLKIEMDVDEDAYMEEWHQQRKPDSIILRFESLVNKHAVRADSLEGPGDANMESPGCKVPEASGAASPATYFQQSVAIAGSSHFAQVAAFLKKESLFDFGGC